MVAIVGRRFVATVAEAAAKMTERVTQPLIHFPVLCPYEAPAEMLRRETPTERRDAFKAARDHCMERCFMRCARDRPCCLMAKERGLSWK